MPALTIKLQNMNLSLNYDALTVYPNYMTFSEKREGYKLAMEKCNSLGITEKMLDQLYLPSGSDTDSDNEEEDKYFKAGFRHLKKDNRYNYTSVKPNHDDHAFYHQDTFDHLDDHYHLKFTQLIQKQDIERITDVFACYGLINQDERIKILAAFDLRYLEARQALTKDLNGDATQDFHKIVSYLQLCEDNDVLANLHHYLRSEFFNYLRQQIQQSVTPSWQGTNAKNEVVATSYYWAMIEKTIAMQMTFNIKNHTNFTVELARTKSESLRDQHCFFAIKRKVSSATAKFYNKFNGCDAAGLEQSYKNHMSKMR